LGTMAGAEDRHALRLTGEAGQGVRRKVAPSIRHQEVQFGRQEGLSRGADQRRCDRRAGLKKRRTETVACALSGEDEHGDPAAGAGRRGGRVVQGLTVLLPAGIVLAPWRAHLLSLDPWRAPRRGGGPRGGGAAAPVGRGAPCAVRHTGRATRGRRAGAARVGHGARPAGPSPGYGPAGVAPGRRSPPPALPPAQAAAPEAPSRQPHTPAWRP